LNDGLREGSARLRIASSAMATSGIQFHSFSSLAPMPSSSRCRSPEQNHLIRSLTVIIFGQRCRSSPISAESPTCAYPAGCTATGKAICAICAICSGWRQLAERWFGVVIEGLFGLSVRVWLRGSGENVMVVPSRNYLTMREQLLHSARCGVFAQLVGASGLCVSPTKSVVASITSTGVTGASGAVSSVVLDDPGVDGVRICEVFGF
jgi:hypothetical protein